MKKEKKEKDFLHKPVFTGGIKAIRQLIRDHLQYPEVARQEKIEGTVSLRYTVNYQGKVVEVKVISSLGYGCDEEAIRLVKLLQFEVPKNRKIKVLFHKTMQIHFRLNKINPVQPTKVAIAVPERPQQPPTINYQYLPQQLAGQKNVEKKPSPGYTYTIDLP